MTAAVHPEWNLRSTVTAALIVAFVAIALAVPAFALTQPRPARFGWQMYSVAYPAPRAWLQAADGSTEEYDLADRLAVLRADVPDPLGVGQQLCATTSSPAVIVEMHPGRLVRVACE